jgi:predicted dehydrogenase
VTASDWDFRPVVRCSPDWGIGIIGAGNIVRKGHLPAYRTYGLRVVGIASRTESTVEEVANEWGIKHRYTDWRRLLDLPECNVIDVSYPFDEERLEIVRAAAERGKHILIQKPFAHSMEVAEQMVEVARRHGVTVAVNQDYRWAPHYRAAYAVIERGLIGTPFFATHTLINRQDNEPWFQSRWYARQQRYQIIEYCIHHLDLMRFWFSLEPIGVKATVGRKPGQLSSGDMIVSVQLAFPNGELAVVTDNNASHPTTAPTARFRIEGTEGYVQGCARGPLQFEVMSERLGGAVPFEPPLQGVRFPDPFAASMNDLLCAIEQRRSPSVSGEDNLKTLKIVFDAYQDVGH